MDKKIVFDANLLLISLGITIDNQKITNYNI